MYRISFNVNDPDLGPVVADLHRTGKVSGVAWKFTPGIITPPEVPVNSAEKPQPQTPIRSRASNTVSLQALATSSALDVIRKYHFRRVERAEIAKEIGANSETDQQRITWGLSKLITDGLIVRVDRGKYELSPDELARYKIAHLPGGNGTQPTEQQ